MNKYNKKHIKIISFFTLLLLFTTSLGIFTGKAKPKNPYGEKTWKMEDLNMNLIYKNGTILETKHRGEVLDHLEIKVVSEDDKWAKVRLKWKDYFGERDYIGYYNNKNRTIPDYDHIYFKVKKSNNIAYHEKTDKMLGFFPFYIYHYTTTDCLSDDNRKIINADKKYEIMFGRYEEFDSCLNFKSMEKINFFMNYTNTEHNHTYRHRSLMRNRFLLDLNSKSHYPIRLTFFIPAEFMLNNTEDDEEYVRIIAGIEEEKQPEAVDFLKNIDIGQTAYERMISNLYIIVAVSIIIVIGSISGYLVYKNQGDSKK